MNLNEIVTQLPDDVQVCRCEEIQAGQIRQAIGEGANTINDVMGVCQGIFCTRTIAAMIHTSTGEPLANLVPMTARPPARLIPLAQLAATEE